MHHQRLWVKRRGKMANGWRERQEARGRCADIRVRDIVKRRNVTMQKKEELLNLNFYDLNFILSNVTSLENSYFANMFVLTTAPSRFIVLVVNDFMESHQ